MTRSDIHLDAMLRHLGAAYCESLHGRATGPAPPALAVPPQGVHLPQNRPADAG